jgi:hypothetical protein
MPESWHIMNWVIRKETRTFPGSGMSADSCLKPEPGQEQTYRPVIEDYIRQNKQKLQKRQFPRHAPRTGYQVSHARR